jgi:quercetin dioxygenase-like cupin family protein
MQLFRFDAEVGRAIDLYESRALRQVWLARTRPGPEVHLSAMHLGPGGEVGYHPAGLAQLFVVVQGEGWVRGEAPERAPIRTGQIAFWAPGEWHAAGTTAGLTAIVIEGEGVTPATSLQPLNTYSR